MRTLSLLALLLAAISLMLTAVAYAHPDLAVIAQWGFPGRPLPAASPGQEMVPISVTVVNPYKTVMIDDLRVKLELPSELTWYGSEQTCKVPLPLVPGKLTNYTCIFYVSVKPNAKPGMVKLKVKLSYVVYSLSREVPQYLGEHEEVHEVELPIIGYSGVSVIATYFKVNASLLGPGARDLPLTVEIMNTGTSTLYNVTVSLVLKPPLRAEVNGKVLHALNKTIGILPPGRPVPVVYLVDLTRNTTGGCFYEDVLIRAGIYAKAVFRQTIRICIPKVNIIVLGAQWGIPGTNMMMCIGPESSNIPLTVYVVSTTYIANASICLNVSPPLLPSSPITCRNITLVGGRPTTLTYIVNLGNYRKNRTRLALTLRYDNVTIKRMFDVSLPKPKVKILAAAFTPPVLMQDLGTAMLNLTLMNVGQGCARKVRLEVRLPRGISPVSTNYTNVTLPLIPPGREVPMIIPVTVRDVEPGQVPIEVKLCLSNRCTSYTYTVKVLRRPLFKVVSVKTRDLYPGSDHGVIEVTLRYVSGPELASMIVMLSTPPTMTVKTPGSETLIVPPQVVFADVKPGDVIRLAWRIDIDSTTPPGNYNASIVIKYVPRELAMFLHGNMLVTSLTVTVPVRETLLTLLSKHIPEIGSAIIAIIAIAAVVAARRRRKRMS